MEAWWASFGVGFLLVLVAIGYITNFLTLADFANRLIGKAPRPATKEQADEALRLLNEIQMTLAPPPQGSAPIDVEQLAAQATSRTERLLQEAIDLQKQHREREAIDCLYEAFRRDLEPPARAQLHLLLGNGFARLSELKEAEGHYQQALAASRAAKDSEGEAAAMGNLGLIYQDRGDLDRAAQYHQDALAIDREIGNRLGEAQNLGNLGNIYFCRADLDQAEQHYQDVLDIHREIGNPLSEANALGNLGLLYQDRGDLDRAEQYLQDALTINREIGDRLAEAKQLGNLGLIWQNRGDFDRAERYHKDALAIDREIGRRLGEANQLANLGLVAVRRRQIEEACGLLKEAAAIFDAIGAGGPAAELAHATLKELGCEEDKQEA